MQLPVFKTWFSIVAIAGLFLLSACQEQPKQSQAPLPGKPSPQPQTVKTVKTVKTVQIASLDELLALFDRLNYTRNSWAAGNRAVPRLTFDSVSERWQQTSQEIPVALKKQIFFRLMAPLVLMANESILNERQQIESGSLNDPALQKLAVKYKLLDDATAALSENLRQELLVRVDILPPSLVLAQAAEESGWGSSRFTIEGNAFFGQWDFSGNGMVPAEQRKELGNYGLARFATPLASVKGYMLNLNTHSAYAELRRLRAELRAQNKQIRGYKLAGTLGKYSERGQAYIDGLRKMIRHNKLEPVDEAYLADGHTLRLVTAED